MFEPFVASDQESFRESPIITNHIVNHILILVNILVGQWGVQSLIIMTPNILGSTNPEPTVNQQGI